MPARSAPGWQAAARRRRRSSSVSESWRTAVRRMASAIRRAWPRPRSASGSHGIWKKNMYQLRTSWRRLVPRCCAKIAGCGQFITTSRRVASGCSMAKVQATARASKVKPLGAAVRLLRANAGPACRGAPALSNRMTGLSLPRAGRIMSAMAPRDRFLLCTPRFYRVEYVINPWMEGNVGRTDAEEAMRQWEALRAALAARADLELLEPAAGLPDMPFTANAGLLHEDTFVPARVRLPH